MAFTANPARVFGWDLNCCSENSGLFIELELKIKCGIKRFSLVLSFLDLETNWTPPDRQDFLLLFLNASFDSILQSMGLQEILLPRGLDITSIASGLSMPLELQNNNRLSRGCHCPFKGLKSTDLIIIKLTLQVNLFVNSL